MAGRKEGIREEDAKKLGEVLRKARKSREWSVRQLSEATDGEVKPNYIYQIEGLSRLGESTRYQPFT